MRAARLALLAAALSLGLAPWLVLGLASVAESWRWPHLLPAGVTAVEWRALLASRSRLGEALATSALLAVLSGAGAAVVALPIGRALARLDGWRRHVGAALAFLPAIAPPVALGTGLQLAVLGLGLGGTLGGVALAHLVPAASYAALLYLAAFRQLGPRVDDEAATLGAGALARWRMVLLPLLRRPMLDAFVLGFLVSWSQVPLTLLAGGGAVRALPVEILALLQAGQERAAGAGALVLLLPPTLLVLGAQRAARALEVAWP